MTLLGLELGHSGEPLTIVCLGAHSDDIEIGCGGTVLRLLAEHPGSTVHWVVLSAAGGREDEAKASAADFTADADSARITTHAFRDGFLPGAWAEVKGVFEQLKQEVAPDVVLTHRTADAHQDHRVVAELTWNTFRDHLIAEYEIPKYEGDLGAPNLYVPLAADTAARKVELLMKHFASQRSRRWFRPETFRAVLGLRAIECNAVDGAAEGLYAPKLVLGRATIDMNPDRQGAGRS